jgi:transcriptional regulator with XRE-family HTH domain
MSYNHIKRTGKDLFVLNMITYREENKLTQREFAEILGNGLKMRTYAAWEERRSFPPIAFCRIIAKALGTDIETMLTTRITKKFSV